MSRIVESLYGKYGLNESNKLTEARKAKTPKAHAKHLTESLKTANDKISIVVDWTVDPSISINDIIKEVEQVYNINVSVSDYDATLTGTRANLLSYLLSSSYGLSLEDVKDLYPEVLV